MNKIKNHFHKKFGVANFHHYKFGYIGEVRIKLVEDKLICLKRRFEEIDDVLIKPEDSKDVVEPVDSKDVVEPVDTKDVVESEDCKDVVEPEENKEPIEQTIKRLKHELIDLNQRLIKLDKLDDKIEFRGVSVEISKRSGELERLCHRNGRFTRRFLYQ